jgi:hypothetical protein
MSCASPFPCTLCDDDAFLLPADLDALDLDIEMDIARELAPLRHEDDDERSLCSSIDAIDVFARLCPADQDFGVLNSFEFRVQLAIADDLDRIPRSISDRDRAAADASITAVRVCLLTLAVAAAETPRDEALAKAVLHAVNKVYDEAWLGIEAIDAWFDENLTAIPQDVLLAIARSIRIDTFQGVLAIIHDSLRHDAPVTVALVAAVERLFTAIAAMLSPAALVQNAVLTLEADLDIDAKPDSAPSPADDADGNVIVLP